MRATRYVESSLKLVATALSAGTASNSSLMLRLAQGADRHGANSLPQLLLKRVICGRCPGSLMPVPLTATSAAEARHGAQPLSGPSWFARTWLSPFMSSLRLAGPR